MGWTRNVALGVGKVGQTFREGTIARWKGAEGLKWVQAVYSVVVVCVNWCGRLYLSKGIPKRSEVADTRGSIATGGPL
jgi:hypothetical protein